MFAHTKFGLVQKKGSGVKGGGGRIPPPRPERVFEIPAWIGLSVNPLQLPQVMEVASLRGKRFSETTNQDSH